MPHDPVRAKDAMAWLRKAELDLGAGATDIAAIPPYLGDAVFHAQQAVEKSLKALLVWHDAPFRKTHDLAELGQRCTDVDPSLDFLLRCAAGLTKYAWQFRYPGDTEEPSRDEAEQAIAIAREVYDAILSCLPEEVRL